MHDQRVRQKQAIRQLGYAILEIDIFHGCKGETFIEASHLFKKDPPNGKITRPQMPSGQVYRCLLVIPALWPVAYGLSFIYFIVTIGIQNPTLVCSQPSIRWKTVVISKNDPFSLSCSHPMVSIGSWPFPRPLYPSCPRERPFDQ